MLVVTVRNSLTHRPDRLRIVLDPVVVDAQFQGAKTATLGGKSRGFIGQAVFRGDPWRGA